MNIFYWVDSKARLLTTYKNSKKSHKLAFNGIGLSFFNELRQSGKYKPLHGVFIYDTV